MEYVELFKNHFVWAMHKWDGYNMNKWVVFCFKYHKLVMYRFVVGDQRSYIKTHEYHMMI